MLNSDFKEFVSLLGARGVEHLVVGGYALAAHGHPRYTGDIDFWIRPAPDNIDRLLLALGDFGFGSLGLTREDFDSDSVIQLGHPPRRIDLMTTLDGVEFSDCWARREVVELGGVTMNIIGRGDFISNKQAVGRLKDLADIEALNEPRCDG